MLDAGSSGTRVHVYRWLDPARPRGTAGATNLHRLPEMKTDARWTKKSKPGVSTFGEKPDAVGPDHLEALLQHALTIVPTHAVRDTPIFLLATAGVRLLPDLQRKVLLAHICAYARSHTHFLLPDCDLHIQVISGETEGLYGWIAANYLLGGFDEPEKHAHGKGHHTYGFLDMGGASAQIAFAPNATEASRHANDLKLLRLRTLDGAAAEYRVFVTTWLGFGVHQARRRYVQALRDASGAHDGRPLPDPCLPVGLTLAATGDFVLPHPPPPRAGVRAPDLVGTGKFDECLRQTYPLLDKDAPCEDAPCLLHGVHVPAIDFDVNHFVGVSEYWHTTHEIFEMQHAEKSYDFHTYQQRVQAFCSQEWTSIADGVARQQWGPTVDERTAAEVCFKASWLITVLHEGIGVPRVGLDETRLDGHNGTREVLRKAQEKGFLKPFQAVDKIRDVELSWTLGKMLLYAASQTPARPGALPVGFGSNVPGVPADFQYAAVARSDSRPPSNASDHLAPDGRSPWLASSSPADAHSPSAASGIAFLLLVLVGFVLFVWYRAGSGSRILRRLRSLGFGRHLGGGGDGGGGGGGGAGGGGGRPPSRKRKVSSATASAGWKVPTFPRHGGGRGGSYHHLQQQDDEESGRRGGPAFAFELLDTTTTTTDADPIIVDEYSDSATSDGHGHGHHVRLGRSSGWATPQPTLMTMPMVGAGAGAGPATTTTATTTPTSAFFDAPPSFGFENAMHRSGLVGRIESRERLAWPAAGMTTSTTTTMTTARTSRSRNQSPSRSKSSLVMSSAASLADLRD
ncbi:MAG: Golgi apyrase [Phylliscum demangeonii]|nr:MAG: Golgi apyrase [Phylliscum demangeonii]